MRLTIVGLRRVDYVSKKTNLPVKGYTFNCTYPYDETKKDECGLATEEIFINDDKLQKFLSYFTSLNEMLDIDVNVFYNRFGRVETIEVADGN